MQHMQMHESSLKWEEFKTSDFKMGFILKRRNYCTLICNSKTSGSTRKAKVVWSIHNIHHYSAVVLRTPILIVTHTNFYLSY